MNEGHFYRTTSFEKKKILTGSALSFPLLLHTVIEFCVTYPTTSFEGGKKSHRVSDTQLLLFFNCPVRKCADTLIWSWYAVMVRDQCPVERRPATAHGARSATATELRRSRCRDGAATESLPRRSRCCQGAAQTSSVALILCVASRRDALNEEPALISPRVDLNFNGRGPQS